MKKNSLIAAMLFPCVLLTAQAGYRTETTLTPVENTPQYVVEIRIIKTDEGGRPEVLCAPQMTVNIGRRGKVSMADEREENGFFCTVGVKEINGNIQTDTTVVVKEKGKEILNTTQHMPVKK